MSLGAVVRQALGRWEPRAIELYRGRFIDLEALAVTLASVAPQAKRVLEIGCGDGAVATALSKSARIQNDDGRRRTFAAHTESAPASYEHYLGIDPGIANPGGMYAGDPEFASFRPILTTDLIAESVDGFDLVLVCDVLHHVKEEDRQALLLDAASLTAPGGTLALKDWTSSSGPGYYAAYLADRYISGDATVRFMSRGELVNLLEYATPQTQGWTTTCEAYIPPRRSNLLISRRRAVAPALDATVAVGSHQPAVPSANG